MTPGTGLGNRLPGEFERQWNADILADYEARLKKGYPCGTHTLYRKNRREVSNG